jgi:hypothetical protein
VYKSEVRSLVDVMFDCLLEPRAPGYIPGFNENTIITDVLLTKSLVSSLRFHSCCPTTSSETEVQELTENCDYITKRAVADYFYSFVWVQMSLLEE